MKIQVQDISKQYPVEIMGDLHHIIDHVGQLSNWKTSGLYWAKNSVNLKKVENGAVICNAEDFNEITQHESVVYLLCSNPRLIFAKVVNQFFPTDPNQDFDNQIEVYRKRNDLRIGENVFIGKNVTIGEGTQILHNVVIHSNSSIGKDCILSNNCSIGTEGLGLELDPESNKYIKFPQIGGVIIHDEVEIGPNSTIRRSALGNTIIESGTKIGSLCNIGHNCMIGKNCLITSNVIISGSSTIGSNNFLGVGTLMKHGVKTGENVTTGTGAVVVKNIPDDEIWIGNPAKKMAF